MNELKNIKIIVGLSGGVDSSVAALLLKQAGFSVSGVYLKCYWTYKGCSSDQDRNSAARVASVLNIPFEVWDFEKEYRKKVVDYFYDEYKKGRTPNPDVVCNREIKFGLFLKKALNEQTGSDEVGSDSVKDSLKGSSPSLPDRGRLLQRSLLPESSPKLFNNIYIATGHYARIGVKVQNSKIKDQSGREEIIFPKFSQWEEVADSGGVKYVEIGDFLDLMSAHPTSLRANSEMFPSFSLFGGVDGRKDQSYFLYDIPPSIYEHILYPLGNLTKTQVREIAKKENLPTADRPDSSGICFIGEINIEKFLKERIKEHEGKVVNKSGEVIGKHKGVEFYTIGQRHGFLLVNTRAVQQESSGTFHDSLKESPEVSQTSVPPATLAVKHTLRFKSKPMSRVAQKPPYYIIGKNVESNELMVGMGEECKTQKFSVKISGKFEIRNSKFEIFVRIRNLGEFIPCTIKLEVESCNLEVALAYPVFGIASGQSAVFYRKFSIFNFQFSINQVVGGGVIQ